MKQIQVVESKGIRVLTTKQIAEAYGTTKDKIIYNFNHNKDRYVCGKHYIEVVGEELKELKRTCENHISFKYAKSLYLWTEKGALLHAKSLNTDKAWEVYDYLVDFYFRAKEETPRQQAQPKREVVPEVRKNTKTVVDIPVNEKAQNLIKEVEDKMKGIEAVIKLYNRYLSEEDYKKITYVLWSLCREITYAGFSLSELKPRLIEDEKSRIG